MLRGVRPRPSSGLFSSRKPRERMPRSLLLRSKMLSTASSRSSRPFSLANFLASLLRSLPISRPCLRTASPRRERIPRSLSRKTNPSLPQEPS